ncbi:MAG: 3-dehydroquinate synthase [Deltaproteobacteria bacterium RIFOXYA12_FULL_61_11]|nr:MAG: 3-dehydroquinate synthase [Deltaproteobacteria bacterium RIFOXYA12_FULL_61_11]
MSRSFDCVIPPRSGTTRVFVERNCAASLVEVLDRHADHRLVVISDTTVAGLHHERLFGSLAGIGVPLLLTFPPGEASKTRTTLSRLQDEMLHAGCGRDTLVVGHGGGVVTDLAGFLASTYYRGLPLILVPTSLLGMVDASLGGKNGVDVPEGKNLLGTFHHPEAVLVGTDHLDTLQDELFREGMAEVVKIAAALDRALFEFLEAHVSSLSRREAESITEVVERSLRLKAEVVANDPFERGYREVLNLGHTVGHALEAREAYRQGHGAAVSRGLVCEAVLARNAGHLGQSEVRRLRSLLQGFGLPTALPTGTAEDLLGPMRADKKARGRTPRFVLLTGIGSVLHVEGHWAHPIGETDLLNALEECVP